MGCTPSTRARSVNSAPKAGAATADRVAMARASLFMGRSFPWGWGLSVPLNARPAATVDPIQRGLQLLAQDGPYAWRAIGAESVGACLIHVHRLGHLQLDRLHVLSRLAIVARDVAALEAA